jgi:hypothetical protein
MNNVVIGTALNYSVEHIKNFVLSFRKHNTVDDIILIYNLTDVNKVNEMFDFTEKYNVKLVDFAPYDTLPIHVVSSRFLRYLDIVNQFKEYEKILLADVRDVFFQSNPFDNLPDGEFMYAFTEDPGLSIEKEEHHINMILKLFGRETLEQFAGKKIICSGTIIGTNRKMAQWLYTFKDYLTQIQKGKPAICYEMLLDQVIANHIYYFQDNGKEIELKNNGDIVGTIGLCITHPDHVGDMKIENGVIYLDGKIPAIIHQYDRSPELFNQISELYPC